MCFSLTTFIPFSSYFSTSFILSLGVSTFYDVIYFSSTNGFAAIKGVSHTFTVSFSF